MALSKALAFSLLVTVGIVAVLASMQGSNSGLGAPVMSRSASIRSIPSRTSVCATKDSRRRVDRFKQTAAGLAAAGMGALALAGSPLTPVASADISGLTKCSESKAFQKRQTKEIKSLEKQLKKAPEGSPGYAELTDRITRTKARFDKYGKSSLLCGADGLPHLIVGPEFRGHEGEFAIPALGFLYTTGWIGWTGRKYLRGTKDNAKPTEAEIILDVPKMTKAILGGAVWPVEALKEYQNGDLTRNDADVTVSAK